MLSFKSITSALFYADVVYKKSSYESVITVGKIDPKKLRPITFDPANNDYIGLGEKVGNAFADWMKLK